MVFEHLTLVQHAAIIALGILTLAAGVALWRLLRGPTLPDRVIALDLIASIVIGMIAAYAVLTNLNVMLNAAVIIALISFLGTVALARYLERGARQ
ncbi:MAG TPA: monovalent cation/H+ antiporter complex subunit F [Bacteroidota bacterium]|nr:monovalent cation/H+ antiporter complex subunit F [Bacteroidota bacterium]